MYMKVGFEYSLQCTICTLLCTCIGTGFNFILIKRLKTCQTKEEVLQACLWQCVEGSCISVIPALSTERQLGFLIETNTSAICHLASVSSATFLQHKQ